MSTKDLVIEALQRIPDNEYALEVWNALAEKGDKTALAHLNEVAKARDDIRRILYETLKISKLTLDDLPELRPAIRHDLVSIRRNSATSDAIELLFLRGWFPHFEDELVSMFPEYDARSRLWIIYQAYEFKNPEPIIRAALNDRDDFYSNALDVIGRHDLPLDYEAIARKLLDDYEQRIYLQLQIRRALTAIYHKLAPDTQERVKKLCLEAFRKDGSCRAFLAQFTELGITPPEEDVVDRAKDGDSQALMEVYFWIRDGRLADTPFANEPDPEGAALKALKEGIPKCGKLLLTAMINYVSENFSDELDGFPYLEVIKDPTRPKRQRANALSVLVSSKPAICFDGTPYCPAKPFIETMAKIIETESDPELASLAVDVLLKYYNQ